MRQIRLLIPSLFIIMEIIVPGCAPKNPPPGDTKTTATTAKVEELLSQLTLEEKVGQMTQVCIDVVSVTENGVIAEPHQVDPVKLRKAIVDYHVGSILNVANHCYSRDHWYEIMSAIREMSEQNQCKIPVLYGIDAIHGNNYCENATLFPQQIAMAATWNPGLMEQAASITAYETRAAAIPWNFSPVLDIGRQAAWSRIWETFGEDIFLANQMTQAIVKGYEGDDIGNKYKVASCMKHYLGYGFPVSGKDRTPAWIPDNFLREYFLPPFEQAVECGAHTIMINSGEINGVPVHASHYILTEILRNELHFEGLAVSDWEDIIRLHTKHHVAATPREAVRMAVMAGVDMSMVPYDYSFYDHLLELAREGSVPAWRIDEAVRRILTLKVKLGLFENLYYPASDYPDFASEKHRLASLEAARECITLLKNEDHVLPLPKNARVLVTGFAANTMASLNGGWSHTWQGDQADRYASDKLTILEAIRAAIGENNVAWAEGTRFDELTDIDRALQLARSADYIILCLGEMAYCEQPGTIGDISLPPAQAELANRLASAGKPVILVLTEGRPRLISAFAENMDAILIAYLPGNEGGIAITDVLFGDVNPSGKLPYTYPRSPNALINYDHKYTEEVSEVVSIPQFEFGYGLSYTSFSYSGLSLSAGDIRSADSLRISIDVTNTGNLAGKEVVQLYISDLYASITPPVKRLRGFQKVELAPGQTQTVIFTIHPSELAFVNADSQWVTEPGEFEVKIGDQAGRFTLND